MAEVDDKAVEVLYSVFEKLAEDGDAVIGAIDKLVAIEKSGVLDQLVSMSELLLNLSKIPEEFVDQESREVLVRNLELLLTVALSVDEKTIKLIDKVFRAFKETKSFEPAGITAALKALRDPDVQRILGFILTLAKNLGKKL